MVVHTPRPDPAFDTWKDKVARLARERLGVELEALPELPYQDGYEVGDSPAEFFAGAILDVARELGIAAKG